MANIRIKDLSTTASTTASDDFFGVDGATNGTRKLNAYSPTFGGSLTVSGTGTSSFSGLVKATGNGATSFATELVNTTGSSGTAQYYLTAGNGAGFTAFRLLRGNGASGYEDNGFNADCWTGARFNLNALGGSGGNFTISGGNLTVSGGTVTGGTSGLSLASGGTNQNVTLVPSGNGLVSITGGTGTQNVGFNKSGGNNFYLSVVSSADESLRFQNSGGTNLVEFNKNGNVLVGTTTDGGQKLQVNGTAAISGALSIGNTVNTVSPTSPNRTVTIVIAGTTYYLAAKTTND